jgi:small subunit ribosomal protein S16
VAVKIRLLRMGKIRNPQYRIVVADSRTKRDGRAIEEIGLYHPKEEPSRIEVKSERVQHWLSVGAQPSDPVKAILSKTGDWQKFKGLPAPTEPLRVAPERVNRTAIYEAEAQAAAGVNGDSGKAMKKAEPARKADAKKADKGEKADKAEKADAVDAKKAETVDAKKAETVDAKKAETVEAKKAEETPASTATEESAGAGADQAG